MGRTGLPAPEPVGSSRTRGQTRVPCTGGWILNPWTTRGSASSLSLKRTSLVLAFCTCEGNKTVVSLLKPLPWSLIALRRQVWSAFPGLRSPRLILSSLVPCPVQVPLPLPSLPAVRACLSFQLPGAVTFFLSRPLH